MARGCVVGINARRNKTKTERLTWPSIRKVVSFYGLISLHRAVTELIFIHLSGPVSDNRGLVHVLDQHRAPVHLGPAPSSYGCDSSCNCNSKSNCKCNCNCGQGPSTNCPQLASEAVTPVQSAIQLVGCCEHCQSSLSCHSRQQDTLFEFYL